MKNKKFLNLGVTLISCSMLLAGCGQSAGSTSEQSSASGETQADEEQKSAIETYPDAIQILLSNDGVTVEGEEAGTESSEAVYVAHDIIYYEDGKDFTYGEGTEADAHTKEEAEAHTVVHITEPGSYLISGTLSAGQIAVDLGEDAEDDPEAVVTLILNKSSCLKKPVFMRVSAISISLLITN